VCERERVGERGEKEEEEGGGRREGKRER